MREPHQPQQVNTNTLQGQTTGTNLPLGIAPIHLETTIPSQHPITTTIDPILLITPLDDSGVRKQKSIPPINPVNRTPSMNQRLLHHSKINITPDELHKTKKSDLATLIPSDIGNCSSKRQHTKRTLAPTTGGGFPMGLKRQCSPTTRAPGSQPHTISRMSELLATCTDEQYK